MSQATLRAAVLGAMMAVSAAVFIAAGWHAGAAVLGLVGAAIPAGVLYVRFNA